MLSRVKPRENRTLHVSVFALAAIPLLVYLGSKMSDKVHTELYQRHRSPESWNWRPDPRSTHFDTRKLRDGTGQVALLVNVSGAIPSDAVAMVLGGDVTVYELALAGQPSTPLVLNTREDLGRFVVAFVLALERIRAAHPGIRQLHVFPAVPAPVAISLGRHTLPKVGPQLVVYDRDKRSGTFLRSITIG